MESRGEHCSPASERTIAAGAPIVIGQIEQ